MTAEQMDKVIIDCLIKLFKGDTDKIQLWLSSPNKFLDEVQPEVWWTHGKREQLMLYLQRQVEKFSC